MAKKADFGKKKQKKWSRDQRQNSYKKIEKTIQKKKKLKKSFRSKKSYTDKKLQGQKSSVARKFRGQKSSRLDKLQAILTNMR